jgi:hypothetical protein
MNTKYTLVFNKKNNKQFILGPKSSIEPIETTIENAILKIENRLISEQNLLTECDLADEQENISWNKLNLKNPLFFSLTKGILFSLPLFFSLMFVSLFTLSKAKKLIHELDKTINSNDAVTTKGFDRFQKNLDKYRPYIREFYQVLEEEKTMAQKKLEPLKK